VRIFQCEACDQAIYFENTKCVHCGHQLAFLAEAACMAALEPAGDGLWRRLDAGAGATIYKLCKNYAAENICNWALPAADGNEFCRSCRLTRTVPELSQHREAWIALEAAKRRLVYDIIGLKLPLEFERESREISLHFDFLADLTGADSTIATFQTGHADGIITINVAEADDAEREKRRVEMNEPYRTLLGHLRHESGHFYWEQLIRGGTWAVDFRSLFGDESADYAAALQTYYRDGAPADWQSRFVSAYASAHPWEDWAETWAHYLHITDTLETAAECGLAIRPRRGELPEARPQFSFDGLAEVPFDRIINDWLGVTFLLNNLSRGLGQKDLYPFVLSQPAFEKLRFVHRLCTQVHNAAQPSGKATGSAPAAVRMRSASAR
jgi:hypothetical protein